MVRILPLLLGVGLGLGVTAQDIPGIKATLAATRSVVGAAGVVDLRLVLEVVADTAVPSELLTGYSFEVSVDEKVGPAIQKAGKGASVPLAKGTLIERTISLPAARFVPVAGAASFSAVAVQWSGVSGANCVFKIAPDASKVDLSMIDLDKTRVVLVTNHGEMLVSFRPDKAPNHVRNFLKLAQQGFYDGTKFHRVIRNFMIQGGDPHTKDDTKQHLWGQGDPGYKIDAEFNDIKHVRGVLSMARSSAPNSAGSQFYIVHKDSPHLDGQYTAFGNLESGADTLDSIASTRVGARDMPVEPVVLEAVVILPVMH